jgi:hypothetical protein
MHDRWQRARCRQRLFGSVSSFHFHTGMIHFGNDSSLPGVWIAATTSLGLGNIDMDQAVVSTIADRIAAANVKPVRMTPTSGVDQPPQDFIWR